jgi:hypothetical protein
MGVQHNINHDNLKKWWCHSEEVGWSMYNSKQFFLKAIELELHYNTKIEKAMHWAP